MCLSCRLAAYRREIKAARDKINEEGVEDEQTTLECHLSTEITEEALKECCGDNLTWGQWLSFAWSVVRAFGNLGLLIYTWLIIKPLQKDKAWDLEKHIVVFGEGLFSATILGVLIVQYFALVYHREDRKFFAKHLVISKEYISIGANFSFLKLLPLAQPEVAWKFMFQVSATARKDLLGKVEEEATGLLIKIGFYAYVILAMILLVSLALMSVSVKVSQLGFISHGMYWTPTHYLAFGLFINALAGLRGDMEKQRLVSTLLGCGFKHFLFSPVCVEDSHFDSHVYTCLYIFRCCWSQPPTRFALLGGARAFHLKLVSQLLDLHQESRLKALIAFCTMTSEQCIELLKKEPTWGFWSFGAADSSRVKHGVSVFFLFPGRGQARIQGDKGLAVGPFRQSTHYHGKNLKRPLYELTSECFAVFRICPFDLGRPGPGTNFLSYADSSRGDFSGQVAIAQSPKTRTFMDSLLEWDSTWNSRLTRIYKDMTDYSI